jgi:hypothetical protein
MAFTVGISVNYAVKWFSVPNCNCYFSKTNEYGFNDGTGCKKVECLRPNNSDEPPPSKTQLECNINAEEKK